MCVYIYIYMYMHIDYYVDADVDVYNGFWVLRNSDSSYAQSRGDVTTCPRLVYEGLR